MPESTPTDTYEVVYDMASVIIVVIIFVLLALAILLNYFAGLELESLLEDGKTGHARLVLVLTILADLLRQSGLDIPLGVLTREELVGHILRIAQIDS